jgi:hypothetical protein
MAPPGMMMGRGACAPLPCCVCGSAAEHQLVLIMNPALGMKLVRWRVGIMHLRGQHARRQRLLMRIATVPKRGRAGVRLGGGTHIS